MSSFPSEVQLTTLVMFALTRLYKNKLIKMPNGLDLNADAWRVLLDPLLEYVR